MRDERGANKLKIETNWVSPPHEIGGRDHLGTQAPCILIYAQLLPGITNVTDRARYYTFYPWLTWSFDKRYPKDEENFIEYFRRADCLFTLISERHARTTDHDNEQHGAAMVGREKLLPALDRLESGIALKLSEFSSQESEYRYFKNQMGGLKQYYAGTLTDLKLMDGSAQTWVKYTNEYGAPMAEQVNSFVPADKFWKVIESDTVSLKSLDALSAYCACQLKESQEECQNLTGIFFDRNNLYDLEGEQRKRSFGLILNLSNSLVDGVDLTESVFRACTYSASLPRRQPWAVPASLRSTVACWATYQRNDLLSIACQTVFALALRELSPQDAANKIAYGSVESFAKAFAGSVEVARMAKNIKANLFGKFLDRLVSFAPDIDDLENENHEIQIAQRMSVSLANGEDTQTLIELSVNLLGLLAYRDDSSQQPYGGLAISPEALTGYPINLVSFRDRVSSWRAMRIPDFVEDLVAWCLNTHLRVALHKLRQTGQSTFHLRPSDRGLEVVGEIPRPTYTTPRFRQAVQILRDIGALTRNQSEPNRQTILSDAGKKLMEESSV